MSYVNQQGQPLVLGRKIGSGGEGSVFEVVGRPDRVAKIYNKRLGPEEVAKFSVMPRLATPQLLKCTGWPSETILSASDRSVVGIVMPRIVAAREVHEVYSTASRKTHFPKADWRFLIRAARNCAAALATIHEHGVVVGDFNLRNVLVSQDAQVSIIDCDSFQFQMNGTLFCCRVGMPDYVPPELQSVDLTSVLRSVNHDNFGLAVLIFQLLFVGRHPFMGRYQGQGDMPIEKAVKEYRFAYSGSAQSLAMEPPPHTLRLQAVPRDMGLMFERAFLRGSENPNARPAAVQWANALEQLERQLRTCSDDPGHAFLSSLASCPWCDIVNRGGSNPFLSVSIQATVARSATFDVASIWLKIQAVPSPDQVFTPAPRTSPRLSAAPLAIEADEGRMIRNLVGIIAIAGGALSVSILLYPFLGLFFFLLMVVFGATWCGLKVTSPLGTIKRQRINLYRGAQREVDRLRAAQAGTARQYLQQFHSKRDQLSQIRATYDQLKVQRDSELRMLQQQVQQRQLEEYLDHIFIRKDRIPGIGPRKIDALESYGIETARDVTQHAVMSVPGFGEKTTRKLLDWRAEKARGFRFNPSKGIPQSDLNSLEMKFAQRRSQCEKALEKGPDELQHISRSSKSEIERIDRILAAMELQVAQYKIDTTVFDKIPWWY